jgi:hypothetical protein
MVSLRGRGSAESRFEARVRAHLRERRWVRVHVLLIGLLTFGVLWALSHALLHAGVESIALRQALALPGAYAAYLALLWVWARWLLSREEADIDLSAVPDLPQSAAGAGEPALRAGGGGDFGGGGATGSFDAPGHGLSAAAEAAGAADEGAVVLVPLVLVVGAAVLLGTALGFAVFGLFGAEVLLGVAVEIAFASTGGALAFKARREGWLGHALRRTILPMVLVLAATLALGLAVGHWLPQAATLPQALKLLFGSA